MEKRIFEINGVKIEADLREANVIESFKVGDRVKVLRKEYSDSWKVYFGIIIGFDQFKELPTIIVAYMDLDSYSSADLKYAYINKLSKDIEITHTNEHELVFSKGDVTEKFDKQISSKEREVKDLQEKKNYFLKYFNKYFEETKEQTP